MPPEKIKATGEYIKVGEGSPGFIWNADGSLVLTSVSAEHKDYLFRVTVPKELIHNLASQLATLTPTKFNELIYIKSVPGIQEAVLKPIVPIHPSVIKPAIKMPITPLGPDNVLAFKTKEDAGSEPIFTFDLTATIGKQEIKIPIHFYRGWALERREIEEKPSSIFNVNSDLIVYTPNNERIMAEVKTSVENVFLEKKIKSETVNQLLQDRGFEQHITTVIDNLKKHINNEIEEKLEAQKKRYSSQVDSYTKDDFAHRIDPFNIKSYLTGMPLRIQIRFRENNDDTVRLIAKSIEINVGYNKKVSLIVHFFSKWMEQFMKEEMQMIEDNYIKVFRLKKEEATNDIVKTLSDLLKANKTKDGKLEDNEIDKIINKLKESPILNDLFNKSFRIKNGEIEEVKIINIH